MTTNELKGRLTEYVNAITKKSKYGGYVCPLCKSGTGAKGTGAFFINDKEGGTHWKCFSCEQSGDIFDLIGKLEKVSDFNEQKKRVAAFFHVALDSDRQPMKAATDPRPKENSGEPEQDLTEFILKANVALNESKEALAYLEKRGISLDTANRELIGYAPEWRHPKAPKAPTTPRLILPTGKYSYLARDIRADEDIPEKQKNYTKSKVGNVHLFNEAALMAGQSVFVVEGEIDALSIEEVGGKAIALGGTSNINKLADEIEKNEPAATLIIALDNDSAGEAAADKLAAKLKEKGISFYRANVYGKYKDANDFLVADREGLAEIVRNAANLEQWAAEKAIEEYEKQSAAAALDNFVDGIKASANTPAQETGFPFLDKVLDGGLYEGLYVVGAISSLGKTSFVLQMVDQIAQKGRDVLIISLEMSRNELISKSISRHTYLKAREKYDHTRYAKTARGITNGKWYKNYSDEELALINEAIAEYKKYSNHIFIHEGIGDIGVAKVRELVQRHTEIKGEPPIVVIDYAQILAPADVRATDKQNTDKAVIELKRISRDFKIPVIAISSFNRENYNASVSMTAFKESGAIEYSSDVLIGLQLRGAGDKNFDVNKAKQMECREVELVILKQRNGRTGDTVYLEYRAKFNHFEASLDNSIPYGWHI